MGFGRFSSAGYVPRPAPSNATPLTAATSHPAGVSFGSAYQNYFGGLTGAGQAAVLAQMKAAGIQWARVDVAWTTTTQSAPGATCDFSFLLANVINPILAAGLDVLAILLWSPAWAQAVGNNTAVAKDPYATISPADYADYCGQAAAQLGAAGVAAFELWNEPNIDTGDVSKAALGLGCFSPVGYAALAAAAYAAIWANYPKNQTGKAPTPTVLGGAMAGWPRLDWVSSSRSGAGWPAITAAAAKTSVTITCTGAQAADQYKLITSSTNMSVSPSGDSGMWPAGTYVSGVVAGSSYTLSPPPWMTTFPDIAASTSSSTFGVESGYPPDVFLSAMYAANAAAAKAAGTTAKPMFDAVSIHPYAYPDLGAFTWVDSGSWAMVPELRQIMVANQDGAKTIWFTELGCDTGQAYAYWGTETTSTTQVVVDSPAAQDTDLGYLVGAPGLPLGSYVGAVTAAQSWTVLPPTGLIVHPNTTLTSGATITGIEVYAPENVLVASTDGSSSPTVVAAGNLTLAAGMKLKVWLGNGNSYYPGDTASTSDPATADPTKVAPMVGTVQPPFTVTVTATSTGSWTITPGESVTLTVDSVTVPGLPLKYPFPGGGAIQCDPGVLDRTWPQALPPIAADTVVNVIAPGVLTPMPIAAIRTNFPEIPQWMANPVLGLGPVVPNEILPALRGEAQQAVVVEYSFQFVAANQWTYVGPMFVFCWSDLSAWWNSGSFGLTRVDGSARPALAALSKYAAGATVGVRPPGLAGYVA